MFDQRIFSLNDNNEAFEPTVVGNSKRKFTDCFWCLLLVLIVTVDVVLFLIASTQLDSRPKLLFRGHDYTGKPCNKHNIDGKYAAWPDLTETKITICVTDCAKTNLSNSSYSIHPYESYAYLDHWCIPNNSSSPNFKFDDQTATYARTIADLYTTRWAIPIACGTAIPISMYYIHLIQTNRRFIAYLVMNVFFGTICGGVLLVHGIHDLSDPLTDTTSLWEIVLAGFILFFVLVVAKMIHFRREQITTEIEMIAETYHAISKNRHIIVFILFYCFVVIIWGAYWIAAALFMYSVPKKTVENVPDQFHTAGIIPKSTKQFIFVVLSNFKFTIIYHVIVLFFVTFAIIYFCYMVIGAVIAVWYLESNNKNKPKSVHIISMNLIRNAGTAAFAGFIFPVRDIYDFLLKAFKKWCICGHCYGSEKSVYFDVKDRASSVHQMQELEDMERDKQRRLKMYQDIKKEIFPLVEEKIQNLAYEQTVSRVIDEKMKTITKKHLYGNISGYSPNDDSDEDEQDEKYDILSVVKENIKNFKYEADLKDDIMNVIDKQIKKLHLMLQQKTMYNREKEYSLSMNNVFQNNQDDDDDGLSTTLLSQATYIMDNDRYKYNKFTKEGLLFTGIYGTSLCYSSKRACKLLKHNETRLNVDGASNYNEVFGRIGIASVNTALLCVAMYIWDWIYDDISSFIMPVVIVFVVSYTIGALFTMILEGTVKMLLLCVLLDEEKWQELFKINQGKIKDNVNKLGTKLSAILSEHLLIMQLKDKVVDTALHKQIKQYLDEKYGTRVTQQKYEEMKLMQRRLLNAKKAALQTERELLVSIDGAMKLTEYLINVILVENLFNSRYYKEKIKQEKARQKYAEGNGAVDIGIFENMEKPKCESNINSFLKFFPSSKQEEESIIHCWKEKIKNLEIELKKKGVKFESGGAKKKGIERAFYKSFYGYHDKKDGYRYLTDLLRCSFVFYDFDNLYRCFKEIAVNMNKKEFEIKRVKDRFNCVSQQCGYRDLMINVLCLNTPEIEGVICEIQLHHNIFYEAKKISHTMYKRTRLFKNDDGVNEAYKYAKKYIRPTIGRLKVYPFNQEKETQEIDLKSGIQAVIESKIKKLAEDYCVTHVLPLMDRKYDYDLSVLVSAKDMDTYEPPTLQ